MQSSSEFLWTRHLTPVQRSTASGRVPLSANANSEKKKQVGQATPQWVLQRAKKWQGELHALETKVAKEKKHKRC